jgi:hypothetical protein
MGLLAPLEPYFLYIKLGVVAALMAGGAYIAWELKAAQAQKAQDLAVSSAVSQIQSKLDEERKMRANIETVVDAKLTALFTAIANIQVVNKTITNNITKERASDPKFYEQQLPDRGYAQWKAARALATGLPASASTP